MARLLLRLNLRAVSKAAAAVNFSVRVEHFGIRSGIRNTYDIIFTQHRLEIAHADNLIALLVNASENKDRMLIITMTNPLEALPRGINLIKRRILLVEFVYILKEFLKLLVTLIFEYLPAKPLLIAPLVKLTELRTHKGELLAGVRHHISDKCSDACKLHIVVARHFIDKRAFAVNNLIVTYRQHKVFAECIDKRECKIVVMIRTVNRVKRQIS